MSINNNMVKSSAGWSVGFDEYGRPTVKFSEMPIELNISLNDASAQDLKDLGHLFLNEAQNRIKQGE